MLVNATEFKTRVGKYLDIIDKEDVIISRNGKIVAKLVSVKQAGTPNADFLYGLLADEVSDKDISIETIRDERISKKYGSSN